MPFECQYQPQNKNIIKNNIRSIADDIRWASHKSAVQSPLSFSYRRAASKVTKHFFCCSLFLSYWSLPERFPADVILCASLQASKSLGHFARSQIPIEPVHSLPLFHVDYKTRKKISLQLFLPILVDTLSLFWAIVYSKCKIIVKLSLCTMFWPGNSQVN